MTIADRVAADEARRRRATPSESEAAACDRRPAYADIEHLTGRLPPTERAAVVLRYGYDLGYEQIAAVLAFSVEAARQVASSGIRRLRREPA